MRKHLIRRMCETIFYTCRMSHSQTMQHLQDVSFPNHAASAGRLIPNHATPAGCLIPKPLSTPAGRLIPKPCSIRRQHEIGSTSVGGELKNAKVHSVNALNNSGQYFHKQWFQKLIPCAYSL